MQSVFRLNGKSAIVTGGGSGIGKAVAEIFSSQGAHVFVFDVDDSRIQQVVDRINQSGGRASGRVCNVANKENVAQSVASVVEESGRLDIVVNNAGIAHIGTIETTTENDFKRIFDVNVQGVYFVMQAAVPHMTSNGGVILNISSIASNRGIKDRFAYSMSKGAVVSMTLSVAKDYLDKKIRCNCISPARVHTPFVDGFLKANYPGKEKEMMEKLSQAQPIGRMGKPEEIAALALYLCSDEAAFITGCDYPIDGGFMNLSS